MLEYSPTVTGHICNCLRSVSEPYKKEHADINKREREHSLYSPTVEPAVRWSSDLSRHRVRRFAVRRTAGECGEHLPNSYYHELGDELRSNS